ncbi:MAG: heparan-alpha-glucosaminide N-acetyltransferase domain-containing protein [Gammaproteobacteria bacterium]|nr:heparan-alpha-glucosaminide N-acetyltransferase domain-containing protein [Gammaproteobacteria bacterium]
MTQTNRTLIPVASTTHRLQSIDALRGFVMVLMLVDHIRETFYLHKQVSDPVDALATSPELFYTRLTSAICAPVFIWLTGLSAWLYSQKHSTSETSKFLLKRGVFLVFLELTLIVFLWAGKYPPDMFFLQVIWCIGLCMIALAGLIYIPSSLLIAIGLTIVIGHNILDDFRLGEDSTFYVMWAILYQREVLDFDFIVLRTSYPVLPWIGVIILGFVAAPWFFKNTSSADRKKRMFIMGFIGLVLFCVVRFLNFYGDSPWENTGRFSTTLISFLSLTKYPPSFLFNLSTLSLGLLFLALFERYQGNRFTHIMSMFGAAPMFFYAFHLAVLKLLYVITLAIYGPSDGIYLAFPSIGYIWGTFLVLVFLLYFPTRRFGNYKQANKHISWLKYF